MIGNRPMFLVGSGTLIFNEDNEVLLIKRTDNNKWGIPGGSCELGESFEEAAIREAYEETGIMINSLHLFSVFSGKEMHFIYPNGDEVYNAVCIFVSNDFTGDINADDHESSDVGFFKLNSLPADFHPPDQIILKRYNEKCGVKE
jgi:ADP-ribose pyrophosphatase YjhB (NUDIX family)